MASITSSSPAILPISFPKTLYGYPYDICNIGGRPPTTLKEVGMVLIVLSLLLRPTYAVYNLCGLQLHKTQIAERGGALPAV
ncbi:hypothetical protein Hanom_Chr09g00849411 [Helianthus anomalus]